jgi:hypothetical protein
LGQWKEIFLERNRSLVRTVYDEEEADAQGGSGNISRSGCTHSRGDGSSVVRRR